VPKFLSALIISLKGVTPVKSWYNNFQNFWGSNSRRVCWLNESQANISSLMHSASRLSWSSCGWK